MQMKSNKTSRWFSLPRQMTSRNQWTPLPALPPAWCAREELGRGQSGGCCRRCFSFVVEYVRRHWPGVIRVRFLKVRLNWPRLRNPHRPAMSMIFASDSSSSFLALSMRHSICLCLREVPKCRPKRRRKWRSVQPHWRASSSMGLESSSDSGICAINSLNFCSGPLGRG